MDNLIALKKALTTRFYDISPDKLQLHLVNGTLPKTSHVVSYIARFVFLDVRVSTPFEVIGFIRHWYEQHGLTAPELSFDCEVIDLESYDLQIDLNLSDKLILTEAGVQVCPAPVWSEALGTFISGAISPPLVQEG